MIRSLFQSTTSRRPASCAVSGLATVVLAAMLLLAVPRAAGAAAGTGVLQVRPEPPRSASAERLRRLVLLRDPNTRVVLLGTALLGGMAGVVGVFLLLRRRSLIGDVVGHAALPGIAGGFLIVELLHPGGGKSLPVLLTGAFATGMCGALCVMLIDRYSRIKSDAALAIVLSAFYGLGAVLLSVVQRTPSGAAAGLASYLNGKTASLLVADVWLFAAMAVVILSLTLLLFKELTLLCFDASFAAANGWPVLLLDTLLITLVGGVSIIGMQAVGLLLVVATLITPAAAARFWSDDIRRLVLIAGGLGAASAVVGVVISAVAPRVAAGATIVLVAGLLFAASLLFGPRGGVVWRWAQHRRLQRRIAHDDLLRGLYEQIEGRIAALEALPAEAVLPPVPLAALGRSRGWSLKQLRRLVRHAAARGLLEQVGPDVVRMTPAGMTAAQRLVRNHRLWELYLIQYADIAAAHVDHTADLIEHVVDPDVVAELERHLRERSRRAELPHSPHAIDVS